MGPLSDAATMSLAATYVVLPAIPQEKRKTLDDYKRMVDAFNFHRRAGPERHGVEFGYHNHGYGWKEMQGQGAAAVCCSKGTGPGRRVFFGDGYLLDPPPAAPNPVKLPEREHAGRYKMLHMKGHEGTQTSSSGGDGGRSGPVDGVVFRT